VVGERSRTHIHHHSHFRDRATGLRPQLDHRRNQLRGQVVHDEPSQVLEAFGSRTPASTGEPGHHRHFHTRVVLTLSGQPSCVRHFPEFPFPLDPSPSDASTSAARTASAVRLPTPGTSVISSTVAFRSFLTEPKCLINALRRVCPRPGIPSNA